MSMTDADSGYQIEDYLWRLEHQRPSLMGQSPRPMTEGRWALVLLHEVRPTLTPRVPEKFDRLAVEDLLLPKFLEWLRENWENYGHIR